ncbi:MAG: hypothetical protein EA341_14025, partial [Mongoliibacter sp.]|uniref:hypothetical protein n=1 Tax=Mongoliibacter sp. TaxID=2022438 RepID=UPI0012EF3C59
GEASSPTSSGGIMPYIIAGTGQGSEGGNRTCADVASAFNMTFGVTLEKRDYPFGPNNNRFGPFVVTVTDNKTISWVFDPTNDDGDVCLENVAFIVKGSNDANVYVYAGGLESDSGLASPINASGGSADLSNLTICYTVTTRPDAPTVEFDSVEECYEEGETESLDANDYITSTDPVKWFTTEDGYEEANPIVTVLDTSVTLWAEAYNGNCVSSSRTPITLLLEDCDDTSTEEDPCTDWFGETAWADGSQYANIANWFTYTPYNGEANTVTLYAGQTLKAGEVSLSASAGGKVTITITLEEGWRFSNVSDNVKIQGYSGTPQWNKPRLGQFANKRSVPQSENTVTLEVNTAQFYGIHVDVEEEREVECEVD